MQADALWPKGPQFICRDGVFPLGTDSVLLSYFSHNTRDKRACDLGCGAGVLSILLAWHNPNLTVDAIDILPAAVENTEENASLNGLEGRIRARLLDLRDYRSLEAGAYDHTTANPPYYAQGSGKSHSSPAIAKAREEKSCTLSDLCEAAAYLTRWGGRFTLVHKPERMAEVMTLCSQIGLEPKRLRFVHYKARSQPSLFLLECRRGGRPGMVVEPPLILAEEDGSDSDEIKRIYHRR
ncbi:MAG TPA: methyltransferase [Papillibacter sp.]|jgi:tRNA1Val (adenine37-N6)-methyltransferase|nr:methyltransferase [Papillibacter sp.]